MARGVIPGMSPALAVSLHPTVHAARMRVALAGSALLHLLCASTMDAEAPSGGARNQLRPIIVRLESPWSPPERPQPAVQEQRTSTRGARTERADPARAGPATPSVAPGTIVVPARADTTVYTARDLDSLPVPVLPLEISRLPPASTATAVRLELLIDEHGTVSEITIAGGVPGPELRAAIAATAFVPARKDGRAVKSRILLSLDGGGRKQRLELPSSVSGEW